MRLTLVGGGGSRTPVLYRGLVERAARLGVTGLMLYDPDVERLELVVKVLAGMDAEAGIGVALTTTTDLDEALQGADFVLAAVRAGGFSGRLLDEQIAAEHGVLGQETVGPGGFALALRNVPVLVRLAQAMRRLCPRAWLINLTNPAGIVTQAVMPYLDGRVVGVCDSPIALGRGVADAIGVPLERLHLSYGGLNHLGWLTAAWLDGRDVLPQLLASADVERIEEVGLFGADHLRRAGAIPNEYVYFYACAERARANIASGGGRGAFLLAEQRRLSDDLRRAATPAEALAAYRASLALRTQTYLAVEAELHRETGEDPFASAGGYHEMALSVVEAVAADRPATLIVNTRNRGALDFLADDDVVEVPAVVRSAGVFPLAAAVPEGDISLVEQVKLFERLTIAAVEQRSVATAARALAANPLVPSAAVAGALLADYRRRMPGVAAALGHAAGADPALSRAGGPVAG